MNFRWVQSAQIHLNGRTIAVPIFPRHVRDRLDNEIAKMTRKCDLFAYPWKSNKFINFWASLSRPEDKTLTVIVSSCFCS